MINTSIHGVTSLTISEPLPILAIGIGPYYCRTLTLATRQGKKCTIELFGDSLAALAATESGEEAEYWRRAAAAETARADDAEQRLADLQELLYKACDAACVGVGIGALAGKENNEENH